MLTATLWGLFGIANIAVGNVVLGSVCIVMQAVQTTLSLTDDEED